MNLQQIKIHDKTDPEKIVENNMKKNRNLFRCFGFSSNMTCVWRWIINNGSIVQMWKPRFLSLSKVVDKRKKNSISITTQRKINGLCKIIIICNGSALITVRCISISHQCVGVYNNHPSIPIKRHVYKCLSDFWACVGLQWLISCCWQL